MALVHHYPCAAAFYRRAQDNRQITASPSVLVSVVDSVFCAVSPSAALTDGVQTGLELASTTDHR